MRYLIISALFMVATAGLMPFVDAADSYEPRVGHRHPDFTLPSIRSGKPVSLSDFRGQKVLLVQFAAW
jgi:hypothetical protein